MWQKIKCILRLWQPQRQAVAAQDFQTALQDAGLLRSSEHEAHINNTCLWMEPIKSLCEVCFSYSGWTCPETGIELLVPSVWKTERENLTVGSIEILLWILAGHLNVHVRGRQLTAVITPTFHPHLSSTHIVSCRIMLSAETNRGSLPLRQKRFHFEALSSLDDVFFHESDMLISLVGSFLFWNSSGNLRWLGDISGWVSSSNVCH